MVRSEHNDVQITWIGISKSISITLDNSYTSTVTLMDMHIYVSFQRF